MGTVKQSKDPRANTPEAIKIRQQRKKEREKRHAEEHAKQQELRMANIFFNPILSLNDEQNSDFAIEKRRRKHLSDLKEIKEEKEKVGVFHSDYEIDKLWLERVKEKVDNGEINDDVIDDFNLAMRFHYKKYDTKIAANLLLVSAFLSKNETVTRTAVYHLSKLVSTKEIIISFWIMVFSSPNFIVPNATWSELYKSYQNEKGKENEFVYENAILKSAAEILNNSKSTRKHVEKNHKELFKLLKPYLHKVGLQKLIEKLLLLIKKIF